MRKIVVVVGARPQFIKASVVLRALRRHPQLEVLLVHTGQHHDANMSDVFFRELGMSPPDAMLGIAGGGHGAMTGRMLEAIETLFLAERPDAVVVFGDTNSTLAGALAAAKLGIPVAHIEAGLRSFNPDMPEEINRILTDRVSQWLFAPTDEAVAHLRNEGVDSSAIEQVGDVMFDVALTHGREAEEAAGRLFRTLAIRQGDYVLATIHRAENVDAPARLGQIIRGLSIVAEEVPVVWPVHPRTRPLIRRAIAEGGLPESIRMIDPVGYLDMVALEKHCCVIATDSGGVQKEAYFHRVPCVTIRSETEWPELVRTGWNRLANPDDGDSIASAILGSRGTVGEEVQLYGAGDAARRICDRLVGDLETGFERSFAGGRPSGR